MPKLGDISSAKRKASGHGPEFLEGLARGINVLTAFDRERQKTTLVDLAKRLGFPRASVRRSLITLELLGYIASDERQFWLTPKVLELANAYLLSSPLVTIFQPLCDRLAKELGAGISVATLQQDDAVFVVRSYPDNTLTGERGAIGSRLPAYCTAHGRVLLCGLDQNELSAYLKQLAPKQITPHTKISKREIREKIEMTRDTGFAIASQEASIGYRSLAVPIKRFDGKVIASLSCNGRVEVLTEKRLRTDVLPRLLAESAQVALPTGS